MVLQIRTPLCLTSVLKAEVFVHTNRQLRATHLILDYISISKTFQAPKCVINAKDLCLQRINVAAPEFLITCPIPEGTLVIDPIPEGIPKVALPPQHTTEEGTSSHPSITKEEEEREEVVEVSNFEDEFNVFNQILSSKALPGDLSSASSAQFNFHQEEVNTSDEMGIQRKQRSTLQELLESQPGGHAPRKTPQTRLPTPLPIQPLRADLADHKRKREEKWNDVVETMKTQPSQEIES